MNEILPLIFRWMHIIPAIVMVGGVIFMRFCLVANAPHSPSLLDENDQLRKRWARLVMISTMCLLVSGLYNAATKAMTYDLSNIYNALLGIKMLLAFVVFFFVAVLSGRSKRAKRFREEEAYWLNVVIVMMLAIVLIGGYMKICSGGFPLK